ncbi:MAG: hypothetical protein EOO29_36320 [Comamonadaceae bacterium]|nr:MAG: hypothetical protein EOO29_36320 [Comamonadaceae bacterium]
MPEAPSQLTLRRPPVQRFKAACRLFAVTLCATAFLLPGAHANSAKKPAASAKKAVASDGKRSASSSKTTTRTVKAAPAKASAGASKAQAKTTRGGRNVVATVEKRGGKTVVAVQKRSVVRVDPPVARLSYGQMAGLHQTNDVLDLSSSVALVVDQDTHEVLFSKNDHAVLPIASLTKLMTGLLISEARLPMQEMVTITQDDVDTEKGSRSRLAVGTTLSRGELLHLALRTRRLVVLYCSVRAPTST